jgi:hypothetical protein
VRRILLPMPGYVPNPVPAIPENLPVPLDESGFGYAVRYPGRNQPWHWWCPDPERPTVRVPVKCSTHMYVTGAEIAVFDNFIGKGERCCPQCMKSFQKLLITMAGRPGSKLDADFKKKVLRSKRH